MEVKSGYKQTEVGLIPKDWEVGPMSREIERLDAGVSVNSVSEELRSYSHNQSILKTSAIADGQFLPFECKKIAPRDISRAKLNPRADTIIISRMNTPDLVGECGYVATDHPNLFLPDRLWMSRNRNESDVCVRWLNYLLTSKPYKIRIKGLATGTSGSMKNIAKGSLLAMDIPYPDSTEQRAIAEALGDVDALLGTLDQLIAKKRDLKQAAMQQLLTGKTRLAGFHGEWPEKQLGDTGTFLKGFGIKKDEVVTDGLPCIRYGEIYTHHDDHLKKFNSFITPATAKQSQRIQKGDLLFAASGETTEEIGKCVAFLGDEEAYAGGDIIIFRPVSQDSKFLGYLMNQSSVATQKARMGQGEVVVHISSRNLARLELFLPPQREQTAIAEVLTDMDAELAALEQRRAKTHALKQGMMQDLLTGRTRLV